jgi:hypothetical protein
MYTAGTINPGTSTVSFGGTSKTITGSHTLGSITFSGNGSGTIISSGTVLSASGTLTINVAPISSASINTGTLEALGDVVITESAGGTAELRFGGGANQTYTYTAGTPLSGNVTVNKPSGKVTLNSTTNWNSGAQSLTLTSGTLDMNGNSLSIGTGGLTISSAGTLLNKGSGGTLTLAGNVSNSGNVIMQGNDTCGGSDVLTIASSAAVNRTWSGTGQVLISDTSLSRQTGTFTVYSSTDGGNNSGITFNANCPSYGANITRGLVNIPSGTVNITR